MHPLFAFHGNLAVKGDMTERQDMAGSKRSGSEQRERGERITFRCTAAEAEAIRAAAERAGLTVGSYVRSRVLAAPTTRAVRTPQADRVVLAQTLGQLGKVGSNLNQIAYHLNRGDGLTGNLAAVVVEVRAVVVALLAALGKTPVRKRAA